MKVTCFGYEIFCQLTKFCRRPPGFDWSAGVALAEGATQTVLLQSGSLANRGCVLAHAHRAQGRARESKEVLLAVHSIQRVLNRPLKEISMRVRTVLSLVAVGLVLALSLSSIQHQTDAQQRAGVTAEQIAQRNQREQELESVAVVDRKLMIPMRDGKRMAADVYR